MHEKPHCPECMTPPEDMWCLNRLLLDGDRTATTCKRCGCRYVILAHVRRRFTMARRNDDDDQGSREPWK